MYSFSNASSPSRSEPGSSTSGLCGGATWDPEYVLQILNESYGDKLTCVGYAPSQGRRCRNPINQGNRAAADSILDRLAELDPCSKEVKPLLRRLAGHTLCVRFHQNQVETVTHQWRAAIARHAQKHGAKSAPKSNGIKVEPTEQSATAEFLQTVQELLQAFKAQQADLQAALVREATVRQEKEELQAKMAEKAAERRAAAQREATAAREAAEHRAQEERRKAREEEERQRKATQEAERQREAKLQKEREKKEREEEEKRREEEERLEKQRLKQQQAWASYNSAWDEFDELRKQAKAKVSDLRWPVTFGKMVNANESAVSDFYRAALEGKTAREKKVLLRREALRWHPDRLSAIEPRGVVKGMIEMVTRIVLDLKFRNDSETA